MTSKILHPGQQALRDLIPYKGYRRMVLKSLCGEIGERSITTTARVNRVLVNHSISGATDKQRKQITAYVNRVLGLLDI